MIGAPIRCASCNSFMAHDLVNNRTFCANPMCVQSNCEGQSRVEGTLWCPDCQRPFPRGSNHECPNATANAEPEKVVTGNFPGAPYRQAGNLAEELGDVIDRYRGRIGLVEILGVLEILKMNLWREHNG